MYLYYRPNICIFICYVVDQTSNKCFPKQHGILVVYCNLKTEETAVGGESLHSWRLQFRLIRCCCLVCSEWCKCKYHCLQALTWIPESQSRNRYSLVILWQSLLSKLYFLWYFYYFLAYLRFGGTWLRVF